MKPMDQIVLELAEEYAESLDDETVDPLYAQGPNAILTHCAKWADQVAARVLADLSDSATMEFAELAGHLARAAESAIHGRFGVPRHASLPVAPADFRPEITQEINWVDCEGDWPDIDCPKRMPRGARFAGALGKTFGPGQTHEDRFFITTNRTRKHWILWMYYEDVAWYRWHRWPISWCEKCGLHEHDAAALLLEEWMFHLRYLDDEPYQYIVGTGILSSDEMRAIITTVWPEEKQSLGERTVEDVALTLARFSCEKNSDSD